jgi:phospholipase D1/2
MHWQYRTICRGKHSLLQQLSNAIGSDTENYVSFYGLRNYGKLSDGGPLVTNQVNFDFELFLPPRILCWSHFK